MLRGRAADGVLLLLGTLCAWLLLTRGQVLYPGRVEAGELPLLPFLLLIAGLLARGLERRLVTGTPHAELERRWEWIIVAVFVALLPVWHQTGGRVEGEGVSYYIYLRSMAFDGDLDFANEYVAFSTDRADPSLFVATATGVPRNVHSVGPAVLWSPFFAVGHAVAVLRGERRGEAGDPLAIRVLRPVPMGSAARLEGAPTAEDVLVAPRDVDRPGGYSYPYVSSVALGSIVWMCLAALLLFHELRRRFRADAAALAVLGTLLAGPLLWYTFFEPSMSHAPAAACLTFAVLAWLSWRRHPTWMRGALVGATAGLLAMQRWQFVLWIVVPLADVLLRAWRNRGRSGVIGSTTAQVAAMGGAALVALSPQLYAWRAVWGAWLVNPMGNDYLGWTQPALWQVLLSPRHGLFLWHPLMLVCVLGLVVYRRCDRAVALTGLLLLVASWYVNASVSDWWGNDAFGQRRFAALYPFLAWGLAAVAAARWARSRRRGVFALVAVLVVVNMGMAHGYRTGVIRRDWWVSGLDVVRSQTAAVEAAAGATLRWSASRAPRPGAWLYDVVDGRYLLSARGLGVGVNVGGSGDSMFLGSGWGGREGDGGGSYRWIIGHRATVWLPIWYLRDHELGIDAWALPDLPRQNLTLHINGRRVDSFPLAQRAVYRTSVDESFWRRGLNLIELTVSQAAPPSNGDPRPLSAAVAEISLQPAQ